MSYASAALGKTSSGNRKLKDLLQQRDNRTCADCGAPDPKWASANIGVFICLKCCGVHRSLGVHISKVLSVTLDAWTEGEIDAMIEVGGNASANSIYEAYIPEGIFKPKPDASQEHRSKFIRSKYELQEFMKPSLRILSSNSSSLKASFSRKIDSIPSAKGMVEFIGVLKITVQKGTDLAVRDMLTSDPYVVLTLGHQKAQTSVRNSNLNPVWNEELMLSVPQNYGPVKLQVFDHDTFSADDIMGEAEIDIQPLITSAMAFEDAGILGNMQIGKWLKSYDNALSEDSIVHIIDGKVTQEVTLKLQNVESGEIDLRVEWMPLDQ
ncbi:ADP-ribosylation factor GTPase-activating protein AGD12-like [Cynara cardunculus var. scolymus]|uniref:ADP-ribosylation factor GTPase-activating protein AGD12-like n=1 Tax=Cynara cardunculus var. scolymus TaxID=59895 RepID=UPI000D624F6B|nr:ADP-ribosylation factor GTPase-activating protein AGD12-like [Cynara cardunculus var. scolymus]